MSTTIKAFLASPGDTAEERNIVEETISDLNRNEGRECDFHVDLWRWERDAFPGVGPDAQGVINSQVFQYDIFIGIMIGRFGSPTSRADSGTEEEFKYAYQRYLQSAEVANPQILFYFGNPEVRLFDVDPVELQKVFKFRSHLESGGVFYRRFNDKDDFRKAIRNDLRKAAKSFLRKKTPPTHVEADEQSLALGAATDAFAEHIARFFGIVRELDNIGGAAIGDNSPYKTTSEKAAAESTTQQALISTISSVQTASGHVVLLSARDGLREQVEPVVNAILDDLNKVIAMLGKVRAERRPVPVESLYSNIALLHSFSRGRAPEPGRPAPGSQTEPGNQSKPARVRRKPGGWEGQVRIGEDFDEPLPDELLDAFEGK